MELLKSLTQEEEMEYGCSAAVIFHRHLNSTTSICLHMTITSQMRSILSRSTHLYTRLVRLAAVHLVYICGMQE